MSESKTKKQFNTKKLVVSAMMLALTTVVTMLAFPALGGQGYVNFGDSMVICSGALIGGIYGVAAAGLGSMLADLILGYGVYAPATLVIKAVMALAVYAIYHNLEEKKPKHYILWFILSGIVAELIMSGGYFIYESILYGFEVALLSIPGNLLQSAFGIISGTIIGSILVKINIRRLF